MNLLVLGANSDIAYGIAKQFAKYENADLYLASRDLESLEKKATDIQIRYKVKAKPIYFDATDYTSHSEFYADLDPKPDAIVLAFGHFGNQIEAQQDFSKAKKMIETNYIGAVSILEIIANDFFQRGCGFIIGISSVAGDRGRQSNYIYGSAKAGLSVFLSGLRNRLDRHGIRVMTVLPGFVHTKMTRNLELPKILTAEPDQVAEDVYRAYKKGRDVIYTKWFWRLIMFLIKITPESIFKRTNL